MAKPDFIDNRNGNTLAQALGEALGAAAAGGLGEPADPPDEVRIATAYFSPTGFARIADHLEPVPSVQLLLGADLAAGAPDERRRLDETEAMFERRRMQAGLYRMDDALRRDRDRLPFTRTSGAALRKLIAALRAGNMEVRRYETAFLHAKAYIFTPGDGALGKPEGIIAGSSNLTGAGLTSNLELNLGRYDRPIVEQGRQWFDDLWDEAEPYDLAIVFEEAFRPRTPWEIFIRVLWQLYGDEVEEDARDDQNLPLTSFQKHGVARALRLIRDTGGAIVADEVGLGKTFVAGEVLQIYRERRQRALLICPAALRDSTWKKFLTRFQLFVECLSFEELAHDKQLKDDQRPHADQEKLQRPLDEYQLVVVDEAHNYRNPDAPTRAAVLRRLLFGRRRDVLLLTATPVNNSLWDLYHLVRFFVRQDAHFAGRGILSIRERFERAMREDPSDLSPDVLYPIIDSTTVKRTRQFVKKHYAGDNIAGPDGRPIPIVFPQPRAISVRYNLDDLLPGFFDRLEDALDPDSGDAIAFARYMPNAYLLTGADAEEDARARAMVGLLRSGILKRFESSAFAFRETVGKMAREHGAFLDALDAGYVVTTDFMKELSADDDAVFEDVLAETHHRIDAALYDVDRLRVAVQRDRDLLQALADEAAAITPDRDPKLRALADELMAIAQQAAAEATDGIDEAQKHKVLVFSFFEDTVEWIRDFLQDELDRRPELAGYRGRMEVVSGSDELGEASRQQAVQGFAPISMEAPAGEDADRYDLLVSTDVLAEGVNLQQCRHIINFDMPWNPMRLVQRHGRIDRIGSPHNRVFMRTIFPVDRLDQLLNLEQRILDKLAMAAASVGVAAPIEGAAHGTQVFTETRDEIEKLLEEDSSLYERGGTAGAAQTGEEYRQTLRKALAQDRDRIVQLPWKIGSGMVKGTRRGVFFCAVVGERTYLRFVSADEAWAVSAAEDAILREVGTCLRLIECEPETPTWYPDDLQDRVYDFWEAAQHDIWSEWMRETDPANLQPRIRPLNLRVAEFIRANPPIDMAEDQLIRALDILESPWPRREEIMLRGWFETEEYEGAALSQYLVEQILDTGLEPVEPPPLLPPIAPEDIELLCWMGIEPAGEEVVEQ
jgi:hypothetical protein